MGHLLRDWLRALGPNRAGIALVSALLLVLIGPRLARLGKGSFDDVLLDQLNAHIPEPLGQLLHGVYQVSGAQVSAVLVLAVLCFLARKRFWPELICLVIGTGGIVLLVDRLFKPWFARPRPELSLLEPSGFSFPSGHTAGSLVFYFLSCTLLAAHYPRLRKPMFVVSSLWVSLVWLSTLVSRAHWPTDLLAGAAIGYVWLSFCLAGFTVWKRHHRSSSLP